jgi:hypothetical protein
MPKYNVSIPRPSAKRMEGLGKVIVYFDHGWDGATQEQYPIEKDVATFEFKVPDGYEWARNTSVIDGCSFRVEIRYVNLTGSRTEVKELVPQKM